MRFAESARRAVLNGAAGAALSLGLCVPGLALAQTTVPGIPAAPAVPLAAAAGGAPTVLPAQQRTAAPGYYRMMLGAFEVTALFDGTIDLDPKVLRFTSAREVQALLARGFAPSVPGMQTAVNAYLVHTGRNLVLVDVGAAGCFGPTLGKMAANLRAAGYEPAQVDTVLLTHLHPDHACGLVAQGQAVFPNAVVHVAKADADFWLSDTTAAAAAEADRPFFAMSAESVAPYRATGRLRMFEPGDSLVPGVAAVAAYGHTPGHTGYVFQSGAESLLVWGDVVHNHAVQFRRPEIAIEFDVDSRQAVTTRKRLLAEAARGHLWVAGAHLPFPGIGHVRADGKHFAWIPVEYSPIRETGKPSAP